MREQQESLPENSENGSDFTTKNNFEQAVDWRWVEIDGEATVLPTDAPSTELTFAAIEPAQLLSERSDDTVVASILNREFAVNPGGGVPLPVTLLNNGNRPARFRLQCDSELNDAWLDPLDQSILLQPGEGTVLEITIRPPRTATAVAGSYPLTLCVDTAEYPGRYTQLTVNVTINPFRDLVVGTVQMQSQTVNAFRRSVRIAVPVHNTGNITTAVQLSGHEQGRRFLYRFATSTQNQSDSTTVQLEPGQSTFVHALVRPLQRAWVGAQPRQLRPALLFQIAEESRTPRAAAFSLYDLPLFGIWTLAGLAAAALLMFIGLLAAGVLAAGIWWVRQIPAQPQPIVQQVSAPPQPLQPVVVVVPMNSLSANGTAASSQSHNTLLTDQSVLLPSPTLEEQRSSSTFNNQGVVALTAPLGSDNGANAGVPLITAADVSQPGSQPAQELAPATAPQPVTSQPNVGESEQSVTYAQMFQEIALRYDLNWRMLAAQAYIESGFDSLALGKDGDMGLMQILPSTWQEFAPQVDAKDPFESYSNTLVAAAYLDYLRTKLSENGYPQAQWMLVAYNWGPDHVLDFLASGGKWETLDPQRRQYAEDILRITATIP